MSPCSSSRASRGALPRAAVKDSSTAVSVASSGMQEFSGPTDGAWQWTAACAFTARPQSQPALTEVRLCFQALYHGGNRPAIGRTQRGTARGLASSSWSRPRALLPLSGCLQVLGRRLTGLAVGYNLEGDLLALLELIESGALDRADMDENVGAAILRLDKSVALLGVEP